MDLRRHPLQLLVAGSLAATTASAQVVISDDFEVDSSGNYTIVNDGTPNGTQTFAFDYVAAGIPLAPRAVAGDRGGLRLTANDSLAAVDGWTVFHNTSVGAPRYRLTVDVWMNFAAPAGSTEHAHVGVGGDGMTFNQLFSPISGSGAFIAFTGDGGSGSDYRWFRAAVNSPPGDPANTTLPNSHPSYLGHGSNNTGAFFTSLFPSPPSTIAGSPGNIWTTLVIDVDHTTGVISFYFDNQLTFQGMFANSFAGLVSLGLADTFTSVSGASNVFALFDNLEVEEIPVVVGSAYCTPAVVNSSGMPGELSAVGSPRVIDNNLVLTASQLPQNSFGIFLSARGTASVPNAGGGQGTLCVDGTVGRGVGGQIYNSGATGTMSATADLMALPLAAGPAPAVAGETWYFQAWFRDAVGGAATSNLTNGWMVTFQ